MPADAAPTDEPTSRPQLRRERSEADRAWLQDATTGEAESGRGHRAEDGQRWWSEEQGGRTSPPGSEHMSMYGHVSFPSSYDLTSHPRSLLFGFFFPTHYVFSTDEGRFEWSSRTHRYAALGRTPAQCRRPSLISMHAGDRRHNKRWQHGKLEKDYQWRYVPSGAPEKSSWHRLRDRSCRLFGLEWRHGHWWKSIGFLLGSTLFICGRRPCPCAATHRALTGL